MPDPQAAIFSGDALRHHFLEFDINSDVSDQAIADAVAAARDAVPEDVAAVFAFGDALWRRIGPGEAPAQLRAFQAIDGWQGHRAPATQRDVFVWLRADEAGPVFDAAVTVNAALASVAALDLDLPGFDYRQSHDLIGFEDGTANPKDDARFEAALIPDGQAGAGGAYVLTQKWVHDLPKFKALSDEEQGFVVGRTKAENRELEGDEMPPDSHVSRTDVKVDGVAQKIYRRSAPFGTVAEHGLYFLAFACDIERHQIQLDRMYGVTEDGLHDRLIEFSTATTGAYWFAPDAGTLACIGAR